MATSRNTEQHSLCNFQCNFKHGILALLLACLAVGVGVFNRQESRTTDLRKTPAFPIQVFRTIGLEAVKLFMKYDADWDEVLSLFEFQNFYRYITKNGTTKLKAKKGRKEPEFRDDDEVVTVQAKFKPLAIKSLRNAQQIVMDYSIVGQPDHYSGLKQWLYPNKRWMSLAVRQFNVFLPTMTSKVLGDVYHIGGLTKARQNVDNKVLSSYRHTPPNVDKKYLTIHKLLSMFHKRPFIHTRFMPRGGVGIVRARNEQLNEIIFRIHAEFQLNDPPLVPFWFTPAQFTGYLVISQDFKHIRDFNMYLPTNRRLNVDLEWIDGDGMKVDIGYMREMALKITSPSVPVAQYKRDGEMMAQKINVDNITWTEEIPREKALKLLEEEMYPFKKGLENKTVSEPYLSRVSQQYLTYFEFPVSSLISHANGSVVHKMSVNEFFQRVTVQPVGEYSAMDHYERFLKEGRWKASKFKLL